MPCVNCKCDLGSGPKVAATSITEDDGDGKGKLEEWCPQCFAWKRAPMSPRRFGMHKGNIRALKCGACGWTTCAIGHGAPCGYCGARTVIELPPKLDVQVDLATVEAMGKPKRPRSLPPS